MRREDFNRLLWRVRGELSGTSAGVEGQLEVDVSGFVQLSICVVV